MRAAFILCLYLLAESALAGSPYRLAESHNYLDPYFTKMDRARATSVSAWYTFGSDEGPDVWNYSVLGSNMDGEEQGTETWYSDDGGYYDFPGSSTNCLLLPDYVIEGQPIFTADTDVTLVFWYWLDDRDVSQTFFRSVGAPYGIGSLNIQNAQVTWQGVIKLFRVEDYPVPNARIWNSYALFQAASETWYYLVLTYDLSEDEWYLYARDTASGYWAGVMTKSGLVALYLTETLLGVSLNGRIGDFVSEKGYLWSTAEKLDYYNLTKGQYE